MKKNNLIILAALVFLGTGCDNYLEEDTTGLLYGNNVLSTQNGLESALTGAYKGLANQWGYGFIHPSANAAVIGGDDVTTHPASNKADWREFDQFAVSTTNQRSNAVYNGCYKAIQGANNVINNYKITTGDQATITTIVGEAHFIRAFSYYWLTRFWGNVPLVTTELYSEDLLTISKSTPAQVYDLIVADLKVAENNLPNAKRAPGRPNKGSAKAFLADVYLTMAGWPLKQTDKYDLAAAKAKEVIDNKDTYGFLPSQPFLKMTRLHPVQRKRSSRSAGSSGAAVLPTLLTAAPQCPAKKEDGTTCLPSSTSSPNFRKGPGKPLHSVPSSAWAPPKFPGSKASPNTPITRNGISKATS